MDKSLEELVSQLIKRYPGQISGKQPVDESLEEQGLNDLLQKMGIMWETTCHSNLPNHFYMEHKGP